MEEIACLPVKWVYEIACNETGEIVTVISRKYIKELSVSLRNFHYFKCLGYFGFDNAYYPW